jgi:single-strand DNA-binding protein
MNTNKILLIGRIGRDPEGKPLDGGKFVTEFTLAVNGYKEEQVDWFNVTIWGKQGEYIANNVSKGSMVAVSGRMTFDKWTDKTSGEKVSRPIVRADGVEVLQYAGGGKSGGGGGGGASRTSKKTAPKPATREEDPFDEDEVPF